MARRGVLIDSLEGGRTTRVRIDRFQPILFALGGLLALVGTTDLALLWIPLDLEGWRSQLEQIGTHFDRMPLCTIGLAFVAAAVHLGYQPVASRLLAYFLTACTLLLLTLFLFYLVVAVGAVSSPVNGNHRLDQEFVRVTICGAAYVIFFGWLSGIMWRDASRSD